MLVVWVGVTLLGVVLFDIWGDERTVGTPLSASLAENGPLVLLSLAVVAAGLWLWRSDLTPERQRTVAVWTFVGTTVMAASMLWMVAVQTRLQAANDPYVIAMDAVVLGSLLALGTGYYHARTEQERAKLERERDRFAALFDNAPGGVARVVPGDDGPVIEAVNPAFTDVFGYEESTAVGARVDSLLVPATVDWSAARELLGGARQRRNLTLETDDGRREFLCVTAPIEGADDGRGWYVVFLDITDREQRAERLSVISRTLRHDIRNDLNVVSGTARLLGDQVDEGSHVERITDKTARLTDLAERTRDIEEAVRGDTEQVTQPVDDIIAEAVASVDRSGVDVDVSVPGGLFAHAHPKVHSAVRELVENAVIHNDGDDQRVEVTAHADTEDYVTVVVSDDGSGIPCREYEVVAGEREHTQLDHPTGLGLWMVDWLVTDSGGSVEFISGDDGTTVRVRLPRAHPIEETAHLSGETVAQ